MTSPASTLPEPREKSYLERVLSLFSRVQAGEGISAILLALNVFLLLGAYYVLKVVRDALIVGSSGAATASYLAAGQALLLLLLVPAYGAFAAKVNRIRLVSWATIFFVSHLFIFYFLARAGYQVGIAFYLWVGIFNNFVVAQFWAFANDIYSEEQGKRLFPVIGVGASLGAWVGTTAITAGFKPVGPYLAMMIGGGVLLLCVLLTLVVHRRESGRARASLGTTQPAEMPLGKEGGFELVLKNRYLRSIAVLIVLLNVVNTTGGYVLNSMVESSVNAEQSAGHIVSREQRVAFVGEYIGGVYSWVNLLSLLIQMFLVSRIFRFLGVRVALFILPCLALGGYGLLAALPLLGIVRIVKIAENSTDYSLMNTIRAALYLPTSREAKYKAKQAIDTFFVRLGDMLQAGVVFLGVHLHFQIHSFALVNMVLCLVWLAVAVVIFREHRKLTSQR